VRASSPQINSLYGSAIGTTVLQLKELPPRPREYDGKLCLFDVAPSIDEAAIKAALVPYGDIVSCTLGKTARPAIVCFATHAAAQAAKRAGAGASTGGGSSNGSAVAPSDASILGNTRCSGWISCRQRCFRSAAGAPSSPST